MQPGAARPIRRALATGALLLSLTPPAGAAVDCPADRIDTRARVAFVYDGDTIHLADGRDVRLVGINTPEIGRDGDPDQPYARAARRALQRLIEESGGTVGLRWAEQRRDDHDRLLAHAYLADGRSLDRLLLERGYALQVTVPPNTWHNRCYARAERVARRARRRIWRLRRYRGVPAAALPASVAGFRVVTGRVQRVGESERAWWLELDGLTLRLPKTDLAHFADLRPATRQGTRVRVRGWIYRVDGQPRMNLRHPAMITWGPAE